MHRLSPAAAVPGAGTSSGAGCGVRFFVEDEDEWGLEGLLAAAAWLHDSKAPVRPPPWHTHEPQASCQSDRSACSDPVSLVMIHERGHSVCEQQLPY